jgi:glycosyltransferase involved in cell wall biosynthesis
MGIVMAADVAVLMAAYNAEATVKQAVASALANTIPCHVFVVDDASRVPVTEILGDLAGVDVIRLERNGGPAAARNAGLARILAGDYRYVAILDADDISYPARFATQVAFLDAHPHIGMVGTGVRFICERTGNLIMYWRAPADHASICRRLHFNNALPHAALMVRAEVLRAAGPYSLAYPAAEDYEFMRRIARVTESANLPDYLLDYRVSHAGMSVRRRKRQLFDRLRIQLAYFEPLQWRAWAGVIETLACFAVPWCVLNALKAQCCGAPAPQDDTSVA